MPTLTTPQLKQVLPACADPVGWVAALNPAMAKFGINTRDRAASFLAQIAHESGQFNVMEENLNYSATRLVAVWPKRFPTEAVAAPFAKNPQALGNRVYADRLGNGNVASGDGFRFRGRGLIQITGRSNYAAVAKALGIACDAKPELLQDKPAAALSAAWFWQSRGLNELADDKTDDSELEDFKTITQRINGGLVGVQARLDLLNRFLKVL
jgi:putative chitinase